MLTQVRQSSLPTQKWQTHVEQCHAHTPSQGSLQSYLKISGAETHSCQTTNSSLRVRCLWWKPRPVIRRLSVDNTGTAHYSLWPTINHHTLTAFIIFVNRTSLRLLWHERRTCSGDWLFIGTKYLHAFSRYFNFPGKAVILQLQIIGHDINHKKSFVNKPF